jgi:NADPH2:quinone reductase
MRALVCKRYGAISDLEDTELPSPPLRPGSVRIAVSFASVSFGIGMSIAGTHQKKHATPFIPGNEVGGIVLEAADDVDGSIIGKRVVAKVPSGAYAQEVIAPRETVYVLPDGVDLKTATALPLSYGTAFSGLFWQGEMRPGESVLIHGATGSLGLAAVQIARAAGAHVLATATTPQKREFARSQGAHDVFAADQFRDSVKAATGGRGADLIFDPIGGSVFAESLKAVRPRGRIVIAGFASGSIPQIPANILLVKNIRVLGHYYGVFVGDGATDEARRYSTEVQSLMETLLNWMQRGQIAPVISSVVPIERYATAMDTINARTSIGKVLLEIAPA